MKIIESLEKLRKWINLDCSNSNIKFLYGQELKHLRNFPKEELIKMVSSEELDFYEKFLGTCGKKYYDLMKNEARIEISHKKNKYWINYYFSS